MTERCNFSPFLFYLLTSSLQMAGNALTLDLKNLSICLRLNDPTLSRFPYKVPADEKEDEKRRGATMTATGRHYFDRSCTTHFHPGDRLRMESHREGSIELKNEFLCISPPATRGNCAEPFPRNRSPLPPSPLPAPACTATRVSMKKKSKFRREQRNAKLSLPN